MVAFEPHVADLESAALQALTRGGGAAPSGVIAAALDGRASEWLREHVSPSARKEEGAYFTGAELRRRALQLLSGTIDGRSTILDPACGAGDLLLECATALPLGTDVVSTVKQWGQQLFASDVHPEFVRATRARLALAAAHRGARPLLDSVPPLSELLPGIREGDSLEHVDRFVGRSHVLLNPPYVSVEAPQDCPWAGGHVSAAAIFVESALLHADPGTHVIAILPDVLRTGTRYRRWRSMVENSGAVRTVESIGRFDPWTDVDVFIMHVITGGEVLQRGEWWHDATPLGSPRVADHFRVRVGTVVPHRDPLSGPWRKYIYARLLAGQQVFCSDRAGSRRHAGRCFRPPFVAVRRTTRPGRASRIVGTLIVGQRPVVVENHLIVLEPRGGSPVPCRQLLQLLSRPETTSWLDERTRCRHFAVPVLRELPWWSPDAHE